MVNLLGQLAKLRLGLEEGLIDYIDRSQELMMRLTQAGEAITGILFNALLINGLPDSKKNFVVKGSFQPTNTFPYLRTNLESVIDKVTQPCKLRGIRKECQVAAAMFVVRRVKSRSDMAKCGARGIGSNKTGGPGAKKQECFKRGQPRHFLRD